jgi:hypothetical protein
MKQRALKDFYDVLKANGFSDVAHVSAENTGNLMIVFGMHVPVVQGFNLMIFQLPTIKSIVEHVLGLLYVCVF